MQYTSHRQDHYRQPSARRVRLAGSPHWGLTIACLAGIVTLTCIAQNGQQQGAPTPLGARPYLLPAANRVPDANDQMEMRERQQEANPANYAPANSERKKQISDDSAELLKLATELKAEVDKTTRDTLSLNVIRKADQIERLAHSVKEKMKLTVGGS